MDSFNFINYYNQNYSNRGLVLFIGINTINSIALITDYILYKTSNTTITEYSLKYPIIASSLCFIQTLCPVSLGLHFWYSAYNSFDHNQTYE
jgi:hypothetical protein